MAMSDRRILEHMDKDNIVIEPFERKQLSTSSYDIRLGKNFYREQHPRFTSNIFNIYDSNQVERVWGLPQEAIPAKLAMKDLTLEIIKPDDLVIMLAPGEMILAHTEEFIGGRNCITTMMKARSSSGRCFIEVCGDAGWGDVGYINRWTLEITNKSQYYHIPLLVGSRVGQVVFMEAGNILDKDYSKTGAYQTSASLEELKNTWHPSSMVPKNRP